MEKTSIRTNVGVLNFWAQHCKAAYGSENRMPCVSIVFQVTTQPSPQPDDARQIGCLWFSYCGMRKTGPSNAPRSMWLFQKKAGPFVSQKPGACVFAIISDTSAPAFQPTPARLASGLRLDHLHFEIALKTPERRQANRSFERTLKSQKWAGTFNSH